VKRTSGSFSFLIGHLFLHLNLHSRIISSAPLVTHLRIRTSEARHETRVTRQGDLLWCFHQLPLDLPLRLRGGTAGRACLTGTMEQARELSFGNLSELGLNFERPVGRSMQCKTSLQSWSRADNHELSTFNLSHPKWDRFDLFCRLIWLSKTDKSVKGFECRVLLILVWVYISSQCVWWRVRGLG